MERQYTQWPICPHFLRVCRASQEANQESLAKYAICRPYDPPPQVLLPIRRNFKTTKEQEHSPKSDSGVHGYGLQAKLSQVYPYEFCEVCTACLSRFLDRDSHAPHLSLVTDLLQYSGDSCLIGISDLVDKEYSYLSENLNNR